MGYFRDGLVGSLFLRVESWNILNNNMMAHFTDFVNF